MARKPFPSSLGDVVAGWIEATCCHGPGDVYGEAVRLTNEEHAFLEAAYAIDPSTGERAVDLAVYSRRKGTRKSELGAWLVGVEAVGPCRAYLEDGEPVARPPTDPSIVCAATTEDQGDLVYGAFRAIVEASDHLRPLFDVGLEVTYVTGRSGKVELIQTRNASALDGARPTFEVADELHLWRRLLHESWETLRRNLRKRKAAQPWVFGPTTAYAEGEDSIAELLHKGVGRGTGRRRSGRLLFDHRQAAEKWDLADPVQLRMAVEEAGGDAFWSNTDGIVADFATSSSRGKSCRYWLNQPDKGDDDTDSWLKDHPGAWEACRSDLVLAAGQAVGVGVDVSLRHDSTSVSVTGRVEDRLVTRARIFRPGPTGGKVDHVAVWQYVIDAAVHFQVGGVWYDPRFFELPAQLLEDAGVLMVECPQTPERMVPICRRGFEAIIGHELAHDGDDELTDQVKAAQKREGDRGWTLSKGKSRRRNIDACISTLLSIAALETASPEEPDPFFAFSE